MDNIISQFLTQFRSPHTKLAYQNDLTQFLNFCSTNLNRPITKPSQITETICVMWQHHMHGSPNQTLARKMAALSSFLKFCQRKKIVTTNPVEFLTRPKTSTEGKTNILTKEEWFHVFDCIQKRMEYARIKCEDFQYKIWKKRYTILYTLFTVGMRVEELCQLKCEDLEKINDDVYRLHLMVKGNQKHAPLIHKQTALVLIDYMNTLKITAAKHPRGQRLERQSNQQTIFENIHRSSVFHMVKLCVKESGIIKNVSPHSLRASLATHLHQQNVPLGHIKELLNHKNMATTLLYTRISETELKENALMLED